MKTEVSSSKPNVSSSEARVPSSKLEVSSSEAQVPSSEAQVSTGDIWQFGSFDRQQRKVSQDLMLYRVPTDLEILMQILVEILMQG